MTDTRAYDEPLSVEICDGEIVLRSPNGPFGVSLTALAALLTAERLDDAAKLAIRDQPSQIWVERD